MSELTGFPRDLAGVLDLAVRTWPDRIVALPEARASAAEYAVRDTDRQWSVLRAIALDLWDLAFGSAEVGGDIAHAFRARTGWELALTERKATMSDPSLMRARKRVYEGHVTDITPHVKGPGRGRQAMRVYFHLDGAGRLDVIGHCGSHLPTAGTRHMS